MTEYAVKTPPQHGAWTDYPDNLAVRGPYRVDLLEPLAEAIRATEGAVG